MFLMTKKVVRRKQQRGDLANDRQRCTARDVVDAAWIAGVMAVARHTLTRGPAQQMTMISPTLEAYEAAERVIVDAEVGLIEILEGIEREDPIRYGRHRVGRAHPTAI